MKPATPACQRPIPGLTGQQIAVLTFLTHGLYLIYWLFQSWRQHRNLTESRENALPLALGLMLPAYNIFRAHATARALKMTLDAKQSQHNLKPWLPAAAMALLTALTVAAPAEMLLGISSNPAGSAFFQFVINALGVTAILLSILHCQRNLESGQTTTERQAAAADPPANWDQNMAVLLLLAAGCILWLLQLVKLFNAFTS